MVTLDELTPYTNQIALDKFWYLIYERHNIWYKRFIQGRSRPWTDDPILREFKFTNVYRELDKGTIYLLDKVRDALLNEASKESVIWNIFIYRLFNNLDTYDEEIGWNVWEDENWIDDLFPQLRKRFNDGKAVFTNAHMVCAYHNLPGKDKLERVQYIFQQLHPRIPEITQLAWDADSLEQIWTWIQNLQGYGPFLAYEIAVDFTYFPELTQLDEDHWANAGPGCMNGLDAMFPQKPRNVSWLDLIIMLRNSQKDEFERLKLPFESIAYEEKWLTLRNIEHCCCEFFKYWKALNGTGRPRNKFIPTSDGTDWTERLKG